MKIFWEFEKTQMGKSKEHPYEVLGKFTLSLT